MTRSIRPRFLAVALATPFVVGVVAFGLASVLLLLPLLLLLLVRAHREVWSTEESRSGA